MDRIIGIDFGTTYSAVAALENGKPFIIPNSRGKRCTPSAVAFSKSGKLLVGEEAKNQAILNPERTILSIKRYMGTDRQINIDGRSYAPEEISAMILNRLKRDAEEYLGEKIAKAVITVPAYFNDNQRQATIDAGKIAGLDVVRIINEPTAAALAYGLGRSKEDQRVLVFDLGGGTFDVSVLDIGDNVFEVRAANGNSRLGGDDFDARLIDYIADRFRDETGIDLRDDIMSLQKLKEEAERAKIELSELMTATIDVPFITADARGPKHLKVEITRSKLEELIGDLIDQTIEPTRRALADAGLREGDIDKVILVGGSTRIPAVQRAVADIMGKSHRSLSSLRAGGVNPDECVALGAAIQSGILTGDVKDIILVDVTPLSLGVETEGGLFIPIIERDTTIPTRNSKIFSTISDNQTTVEIHVLQGERALAKDNISLGKFHLTGIKPAPRGEPRIEVEFDIDVNGVVHVSAVDLDTHREQKVTITSARGLSREEIDCMVAEAREHELEDERQKRKIEARNRAETLICAAKKRLKDKRLRKDEKIAIGDLIRDLQDALEGDDVEDIRRVGNALNEALTAR